MIPEDNSFGTTEFLECCSLMGGEPYLAGTRKPACKVYND
jgi:alpha-L-arabinofuranosidase